MEDPTSALFQLALGLTPRWRVEKIEFDPDQHRLDLYLGFERGGHFACPECAGAGCPVHDTTDKEWRHLNFCQHEAYLHARVPRVRCDEHGVLQVAVPWAGGERLHALVRSAGDAVDAGDAGQGGVADRG